MQSLKPTPLISFNENQLDEVRKNYNYDIHRLKQDIDLFEDWIAKQNHFRVRKFDRDYLERYLIYNKGSIERAKKHFDNLCTYRNLMPEFLKNFEIKNEFHPVRSSCRFAVLPKPTPDNYRVVFSYTFGNHEDMDLCLYYKYAVVVLEYMLAHDYCNGYEFIMDTREMPYSLLPKMNPIVISKALSLIIETMGQRVKGFHFISGSKFLDTVVSLFKQSMSKKVASRVKIHESVESLHKIIDVNILPKEYGGYAKTMQEYYDDLLFEVVSTDEHIARMKFLETATTDESCRVEKRDDDEYLGTHGSFKTMNID